MLSAKGEKKIADIFSGNNFVRAELWRAGGLQRASWGVRGRGSGVLVIHKILLKFTLFNEYIMPTAQYNHSGGGESGEMDLGGA